MFAPICLNYFNRVTHEKQVIVSKSPLEGNVGLPTVMGDLKVPLRKLKFAVVSEELTLSCYWLDLSLLTGHRYSLTFIRVVEKPVVVSFCLQCHRGLPP